MPSIILIGAIALPFAFQNCSNLDKTPSAAQTVAQSNGNGSSVQCYSTPVAISGSDQCSCDDVDGDTTSAPCDTTVTQVACAPNVRIHEGNGASPAVDLDVIAFPFQFNNGDSFPSGTSGDTSGQNYYLSSSATAAGCVPVNLSCDQGLVSNNGQAVGQTLDAVSGNSFYDLYNYCNASGPSSVSPTPTPTPTATPSSATCTWGGTTMEPDVRTRFWNKPFAGNCNNHKAVLVCTNGVVMPALNASGLPKVGSSVSDWTTATIPADPVTGAPGCTDR